MIRKLRWKVIALTMALLTVVLGAVTAGAYGAAKQSVALSSSETLTAPLRGEEPAQPVLMLEVLPSGTGRVGPGNTFDEYTLLAIVGECLARPEESGILDSYGLRYVRIGGLTVRIALGSSAWETVALRTVLTTLLLVDLGALVVLFVCAWFLSGLITRPVARAWAQQRQFVSDAGHELKTPLAVVLSSADLLRDTVPDDRGYIDNIRAEGTRMKKLVESLLTLSRLEDTPAQATETVDLSALTDKLVMSFEPVAFEAGHELQSAVAPGVTVRGSAEQLHRAAAVLLDNALKYGAAATPVVLTLKTEGRMVHLTVENFGVPIPPKEQKHLFDRFYRADASRHSEGFGLGLPIARQIARTHKGDITCRSDERSTRFTLSLPKS